MNSKSYDAKDQSNKIETISPNAKGIKKVKQLQSRDIKDLDSKDSDGRNILHRAAIEQNHKYISGIIHDYQIYLDHQFELSIQPASFQSQNKENEIQKKLSLYINGLDAYGNSALLNACVQDYEKSLKERHHIIELLMKSGADPCIANKRTKWTVVFWLSYFGDEKSLRILLETNVDLHKPDYKGFYPIDLAGKNKKYGVISLLIPKYIERIEALKEYDITKDFYWSNPLLHCSLFYWAVVSKQDNSVLNKLIGTFPIYLEAPLLLFESTTVFHACCKNSNSGCLNFLLSKIQYCTEIHNQLIQKRGKVGGYGHVPEFHICKLPNKEKKTFSKTYWQLLNKYRTWIIQYETRLFEFYKTYNKSTSILEFSKYFFNAPDDLRNTPLHIATMNGEYECTKIMLKYGASIFAENREGFRPKELLQHPNIRDIFSNELEEIMSNAQVQPIKSIKAQKKDAYKTAPEISSEHEQNLLQKIFKDYEDNNPDFVIVFKRQVPAKNMSPSESQFNERINFYIQLLTNNFSDVSIFNSIEGNEILIMIKLTEDEIDLHASNFRFRSKLLDSFNFDYFDKKAKFKFEPFRSKERQMLLNKYLSKIMSLFVLQKWGLVDSYFPMHSHLDLHKIKKHWIEAHKYYIPQPLYQINSYFFETRSNNFTSITYLKQYFGEKIAFYFAWKSYLTCSLLYIAVPGVALQIYIWTYGSWRTSWNVIWVLYITIYSTLLIEFWKRKSSEINARWGTLDLMNNPELIENEEMPDFHGDEQISATTGFVTKYYRSEYTMRIFLASIPVLLILIGACILSFFLVQYFQTEYKDLGLIVNITSSVFQGISITILNLIYMWLARKFVRRENHKFKGSYENSIISKSFAFRMINSFFAVFYTSFIGQVGTTTTDTTTGTTTGTTTSTTTSNESKLSKIFILVSPLVLYKSLANLGSDVIWPLIVYKYNQWKYKHHLSVMSSNQKSKNNDQKLRKRNYIIELYSHFKGKMMHPKDLAQRVVMKLKNDDFPQFIEYIDVDDIENNKKKVELSDMVEYYGESFINFGYVLLFAAAFPAGSALLILMNTFEIRMRISSFIYAYKRPLGQTASGIGSWIDIWEGLSWISVFTNVALLFFDSDKDSFAFFYNGQSNEQERLWICIIMIIIIIIVKYIFRAIITDKASWVKEEEERLRHTSATSLLFHS